jgi:flagellin
MDTRVYANDVSRVQVSDYVNPGKYALTVTAAATNVTVTSAKDYASTAQVGVSGSFTINGAEVDVSETDTFANVFEKIRDAAEMGNATAKLDATSNELTLESDVYGRESAVKLNFDSQELADALGFVVNQAGENSFVNGTVNADGTVTYTTGTDAKIALDVPGDGTGFQHTATYTTDGNKITVTDNGGFSMSFLLEAGFADEVNFDVTDIGTMTLHIGANEHQNIEVRIEEVSSESLYIDDVDVRTVGGASKAISQFDDAISKVTSVRAKLGAYQNRLESSVSSLDTFEENMTDALSRLTDTDMAEEMTNYTQLNVLNQAAISVLTQANDLPQQVLQILQ